MFLLLTLLSSCLGFVGFVLIFIFSDSVEILKPGRTLFAQPIFLASNSFIICNLSLAWLAHPLPHSVSNEKNFQDAPALYEQPLKPRKIIFWLYLDSLLVLILFLSQKVIMLISWWINALGYSISRHELFIYPLHVNPSLGLAVYVRNYESGHKSQGYWMSCRLWASGPPSHSEPPFSHKMSDPRKRLPLKRRNLGFNYQGHGHVESASWGLKE